MDNQIYILSGIGALLVLFISRKGEDALLVSPKVYQWVEEAERASNIAGIPANVILAVISQESQGDPNAVGSIGEVGLMQITKDAALDVGYSRVPKDPAENIIVGARYLALLISENGNLFDSLRAYNYGRTRVRNGSSGGSDYAEDVIKKLSVIDGKRGIR